MLNGYKKEKLLFFIHFSNEGFTGRKSLKFVTLAKNIEGKDTASMERILLLKLHVITVITDSKQNGFSVCLIRYELTFLKK